MVDHRSIIIPGVIVFLIASLAGCGDAPYEFAPVYGVVTLDGEPLADARITFEPKRQGKSLIAGPDSVGRTDSEGRFGLEATSGYSGAVVGLHAVRISTKKQEMNEDKETFRVIAPERVPVQYNRASKLTADVPPVGRDDLIFELHGQRK